MSRIEPAAGSWLKRADATSRTTPNRKTEPRPWQTTFLVNRALVQQIRETVQGFFSLESTPAVLDVGCGSMPYLSLFRERCRNYVGCDYFPASSEIIRCPADELAFGDASFDAVVCFQVLEHVRRPWQVVRECARVVRPGGIVVLSAPFVFPHHSSPQDFFRFTHEGLATLAEEAGLVVEKTTAQCSSLATLLLMTNWYVMIVQGVLRRTKPTTPLAWLLTCLLVVPLNVAGILLDSRPFRRPFTKGAEGYSNFLIVCRKAA